MYNVTFRLACGCLRALTCARACIYVAFLIQRVTRMTHIVTSFVASLANHIYRHSFTNDAISEKNLLTTKYQKWMKHLFTQTWH